MRGSPQGAQQLFWVSLVRRCYRHGYLYWLKNGNTADCGKTFLLKLEKGISFHWLGHTEVI